MRVSIEFLKRKYEANKHLFSKLLISNLYKGDNPAEPYTNPGAPVHIISGSAGCRERHDGFVPNPPAWSDFRSLDYGYTIMKVNTINIYGLTLTKIIMFLSSAEIAVNMKLKLLSYAFYCLIKCVFVTRFYIG